MPSARFARRSIAYLLTIALLAGCSTDTFTDGDSGLTDAAADSTFGDGGHDDASDASDDGGGKKDAIKPGGFTCGPNTCTGVEYCEVTTAVLGGDGAVNTSYQCIMLPSTCMEYPRVRALAR
jgi:hypothetical protein